MLEIPTKVVRRILGALVLLFIPLFFGFVDWATGDMIWPEPIAMLAMFLSVVSVMGLIVLGIIAFYILFLED